MARKDGKSGRRADTFLVEAGYFDSRSAARAAIEAGCVLADGVLVRRPSQMLHAGMAIEASPAHPYVSRGGVKLAHALGAFGIDVAGRCCLDLGASTGGFTDVLLQRGAAHVIAVDVGTGQLHPRLRDDHRVRVLEQQDVRTLEPAMIGALPDLLVGDLSFISLEKALAGPLSLAAPVADLVVLFKPQFQVGRAHVGRGGLVRAGEAVEAAEAAFTRWLDRQGWDILAWEDSPIRGGDGNAERLVHARRRRSMAQPG